LNIPITTPDMMKYEHKYSDNQSLGGKRGMKLWFLVVCPHYWMGGWAVSYAKLFRPDLKGKSAVSDGYEVNCSSYLKAKTDLTYKFW